MSREGPPAIGPYIGRYRTVRSGGGMVGKRTLISRYIVSSSEPITQFKKRLDDAVT